MRKGADRSGHGLIRGTILLSVGAQEKNLSGYPVSRLRREPKLPEHEARVLTTGPSVQWIRCNTGLMTVSFTPWPLYPLQRSRNTKWTEGSVILQPV